MYEVIQHRGTQTVLCFDGKPIAEPREGWEVDYNKGGKMRFREFQERVRQVFGFRIPNRPTPRTPEERDRKVEAQRKLAEASWLRVVEEEKKQQRRRPVDTNYKP